MALEIISFVDSARENEENKHRTHKSGHRATRDSD